MIDDTRDVVLYMNEIREMYLSLHTATIPQNPKYLHNIPDVQFQQISRPDKTGAGFLYKAQTPHDIECMYCWWTGGGSRSIQNSSKNLLQRHCDNFSLEIYAELHWLRATSFAEKLLQVCNPSMLVSISMNFPYGMARCSCSSFSTRHLDLAHVWFCVCKNLGHQ